MKVTHGTGVFPGSNNANIRLDFFLVSEQENRIPNQLEFEVLSEATLKSFKKSPFKAVLSGERVFIKNNLKKCSRKSF